MKTQTVKYNEALSRLAVRRKLTNREQLARLAKRPGEAKREHARLKATV